MSDAQGGHLAFEHKAEDLNGQGSPLSAARCAGTGFAGNACEAFAASSRSTTLVFSEHFADELASLRCQLDEAVREHRLREDRLIAHLVEQAATSFVDVHEVRSAQLPPVGALQAPASQAVGELFDSGHASYSSNGTEAGPDGSEPHHAEPGKKRRSSSKMVQKRSSVNTACSQTLAQHPISLEIVDLLDDLKDKHARKSYALQHGRRVTCRESCETFAEQVMVKVLEAINKCLHLEEPARTGRLASILRSKYWDTLICFAIAFNAIFMIFQVDWEASNYNSDLETPLAMQAVEFGLIAFFIIELVLKLCVHRLYYFSGDNMRWNIFDFSLVLLSLYDVIIEHFDQGVGGNLTFFRSLRILKMTRVLRVIRVLKFAGQLRRMLLSILGSMSSLFWAFAVLLFVFYMFGLLAVQSLSTKMQDLPLSMSPEEFAAVESEVNRYFGSVSSAMLTYYMATTGGIDWSIFYNLMIQVSKLDAVILILVVGFTQVALFNVLTGIFVENAMKVGKPDRDTLALEQRREEIKEAKSLRKFLNDRIDRDSSGTITFEEFSILAQNPRVNAVFASMGLDVKDAKLFFEMINRNDEDAALEVDFLVEACMKMRGPATSLDVQSLLYKSDQLARQVDRLMSDSRPHFDSMPTGGEKETWI